MKNKDNILKTKRDVYRWWRRLGRDECCKNDFDDFVANAGPSIRFTSETKGDGMIAEVYTKRSKYPIRLYFLSIGIGSLECFKITGY